MRQHVFHIGVLLFCCHRDNALMISGFGQPRKLFAWHGAQRHSGGAAELSDLLHARIAASRHDRHAIKAASARGERFFHGMYAKNDHGSSACANFPMVSVAAIGGAHKWLVLQAGLTINTSATNFAYPANG